MSSTDLHTTPSEFLGVYDLSRGARTKRGVKRGRKEEKGVATRDQKGEFSKYR
jgi:hypothetical protein